MYSKEIHGLRTAAKIAGISPEAMRQWCTRYGIGRKEDGQWVINRRELSIIAKAYGLVGVRRKAASK